MIPVWRWTVKNERADIWDFIVQDGSKSENAAV